MEASGIRREAGVASAPPGTDGAVAGFVDLSEKYRGKGLPNGMSVDVEDYFQVSAFEPVLDRADWDNIDDRLHRNMARILELFDSRQIKATFFTLGWVCERYPRLVRSIVEAGHELASHGYDHTRVSAMSPDRFAEDVSRTRKLLEDTGGVRVTGYRAPSFSIGAATPWAHEVLAEAGYRYSSSIYPISHDHYGLPRAPRHPFTVPGTRLLEVPLASARMFGRNLPCAGGGYFRLLPLQYSLRLLRRINERERMPAAFYFHPWEIDPDQPVVAGLDWKTRFRHYVNLERFEGRLQRLLETFRWSRMDSVYLDHAG